MDTISDDLTRPLGRKPTRVRPDLSRIVAPAVAIGCGALVCGALAFIQIYGDPLGGVPHSRVEIATKPPAAAPVSATAAPDEPGGSESAKAGRRSAGEVERASGVSVVRPPGAAIPDSIIVRVPDEIAVGLAPAPDPRLVEQTKSGSLPRIGPDGLRALDVYARPVTGLPNDMRPAGRVAIAVGGLGISQSATASATARLPSAITFAFAPYGQNLDAMVTRARESGHEIMLQVPMEPFDYPDSDPGPHTLTTAAKPAENLDRLRWAMARFTGYVGLVNYMGGKLTADERALDPLLREVGSRGLGFLDDGTSSRSLVTAYRGGTRVARAEVVIDASARADHIDKALERLEAAARASGAIAIGTASALPLSIERIERWARGLEAKGILLVPVSATLRAPSRDSAVR